MHFCIAIYTPRHVQWKWKYLFDNGYILKGFQLNSYANIYSKYLENTNVHYTKQNVFQSVLSNQIGFFLHDRNVPVLTSL